MDVDVVDARDVRIGDDYKGQVPQSLYAMSKPYREQRESEIGGGKEGVCGEWRSAMSFSLRRPTSLAALKEKLLPHKVC